MAQDLREKAVNLLRQDARMTEKELRSRLGVGRVAVKRLLAELDTLGARYTSLIDFNGLGHHHVILLCGLSALPQLKEKTAVNTLRRVSGDLAMAECCFPTMLDAERMMEELENNGDGIKQQVHVLETLKREGFLLQ